MDAQRQRRRGAEVFGRPPVFRVPARAAPQRPGEVDALRFAGLLDIAPNLPRRRGDSLPAPVTPQEGLTIPFVEPQGEEVAFVSPGILVLTSERGRADHATIASLRISGLTRAAP